MCLLCRIVGRNIFSGVDDTHDATVDDDAYDVVEIDDVETWYVWRRGDSMVGVTNVDPRLAFAASGQTFHVLGVSTDVDEAQALAAVAASCN